MTTERSPLVSIVIPTFNDLELLKGAIAMWRGQTWRNLELIVVDDGSAEPVEPHLREGAASPGGISCLRHPRNKGINEALRSGLARAKGAFVYQSSTNDPVAPDFVEAAVGALERHPGAGMCFFDAGVIEGWSGARQSFPLRLAARETYFDPDRLARLMRRSPFHISSNSAVFRTERLREIGGYRPEFEIYADWFGCMLTALRAGAVYVPRTLAFSRIHEGAYSERKRWPAAYRGRMVRRLLATLAREFPEVAERLRRARAISGFGAGAVLRLWGDPAARRFVTPGVLVQAVSRSAWWALQGAIPAGWRRAARQASAAVAGSGFSSGGGRNG
jgi:glycosyltransferase involved in cell wall biosynthesis